ncbi:hypothetical protein [Xanthocytophaga flava]|nr:hypothetical protein [Xanthocytophaga flavus]MDJ1472539.1 hypothetical protein [Xanthocytophaga flavus]
MGRTGVGLGFGFGVGLGVVAGVLAGGFWVVVFVPCPLPVGLLPPGV